MTSSTREADEAERAVLARRSQGQREGESGTAAAQRREVVTSAVIGAVLVVVALLLPPTIPVVARVIAGGLGAMFVLFGVLGARAAARRTQGRLADLARAYEERGGRVTEYRLDVTRIVTATDANGDGQTWWLFGLRDGGWVAFEETQWADLDVGLQVWHRDMRIALDGRAAALSLRGEGPAVPVEKRGLQPPDHAERPDTLYWSPPPGTTSFPVAFTDDPTAARR